MEKLIEIRQCTLRAVTQRDIPGASYWADQLEEIDAELKFRIQEAGQQLDGTIQSAVSVLTGFSPAELDELGGFT